MSAQSVVCANDRCPQFLKTGRRRYIGEGTKLQCSKCRAWTASEPRIMLSTASSSAG